MKITPVSQERHQHLQDRLIRMGLLKMPIDVSTMPHDSVDSALANAIQPAIERLLNKGLPALYHTLYLIDVSEEEVKAKITDLENTAMIPAVIAYTIIDRLKTKYSYQILNSNI